MRSTLNSFIVDFGHDAPTNYARIASVSLITGIHLTALEDAFAEATDCGEAEAWGGGINHIIDRVSMSSYRVRFRIYNRYETRDRRTDSPAIN